MADYRAVSLSTPVVDTECLGGGSACACALGSCPSISGCRVSWWHAESRVLSDQESLRKERAHECAEFVGALHDLGVAGSGQDSEPAVGEEIEHLGGVVEADEVAVADHEERGAVIERISSAVQPAKSCTTGCMRSRNGKKSAGSGATDS